MSLTKRPLARARCAALPVPGPAGATARLAKQAKPMVKPGSVLCLCSGRPRPGWPISPASQATQSPGAALPTAPWRGPGVNWCCSLESARRRPSLPRGRPPSRSSATPSSPPSSAPLPPSSTSSRGRRRRSPVGTPAQSEYPGSLSERPRNDG